jgi:ribonucleotide monophosphatase NagD (HAD superfamily)
MKPIYVDIEGVLIDEQRKPLQRRIDAVRLMIRNNKHVVVWSEEGTEYAREFCRRHSLTPLAVLGKPLHIIQSSEWLPDFDPPEILDL